jgi:hypothetical protein
MPAGSGCGLCCDEWSPVSAPAYASRSGVRLARLQAATVTHLLASDVPNPGGPHVKAAPCPTANFTPPSLRTNSYWTLAMCPCYYVALNTQRIKQHNSIPSPPEMYCYQSDCMYHLL